MSFPTYFETFDIKQMLADYPVGDEDPVGVVKNAVTLSNADLQMVAGGTATRLLGIEVAQKPQAARSA